MKQCCRRKCLAFPLLAGWLATVGCSSNGGQLSDSGDDLADAATADTGIDKGADWGSDPMSENGDAAVDVAADILADPAADAGSDAPSDLGPDLVSEQLPENADPSSEAGGDPAISSPFWAKSYGLESPVWANSVVPLADGGFVLVGNINTFTFESAEVGLLKVDKDGGVVFQKSIGGSKNDSASAIRSTSDGGFVFVGDTLSFGNGGRDLWVVKLKEDGSVDWQKAFGGQYYDYGTAVEEVSDGYVVCGHTSSFGAGGEDAWVLKLNKNGTVQWQKTFGGEGNEFLSSIRQTPDLGFILAGSVEPAETGSFNAWILKLDVDGVVVWQKTYGEFDQDDLATSIEPAEGGGYFVGGKITQWLETGTFSHFWILKLTADGSIDWQKRLDGDGATSSDEIRAGRGVDGGYLVAGLATSVGSGGEDMWAVKLGATGAIVWQRAFGGAGDDEAYGLQLAEGGGVVLVGGTQSFSGVEQAKLWIVRTLDDGSCPPLGMETAASILDANAAAEIADFGSANSAAGATDTQATVTDLDFQVQSQAP